MLDISYLCSIFPTINNRNGCTHCKCFTTQFQQFCGKFQLSSFVSHTFFEDRNVKNGFCALQRSGECFKVVLTCDILPRVTQFWCEKTQNGTACLTQPCTSPCGKVYNLTTTLLARFGVFQTLRNSENTKFTHRLARTKPKFSYQPELSRLMPESIQNIHLQQRYRVLVILFKTYCYIYIYITVCFK